MRKALFIAATALGTLLSGAAAHAQGYPPESTATTAAPTTSSVAAALPTPAPTVGPGAEVGGAQVGAGGVTALPSTGTDSTAVALKLAAGVTVVGITAVVLVRRRQPSSA